MTNSARRGQRLVESATRQYGRGLPLVTATSETVLADPFGARWFDGDSERSTREMAMAPVPADWLILGPGCLNDADTLEALDDRGATLLPSLRPYVKWA